MVAHIDKNAASKKVAYEYRFNGLHNHKNASSWWWIKRGQQSRGRSISGITTKLHLVITPEGHVIEGMLTGGNVADISVADSITEDIRSCYVVEDKGYDSNKHRATLRSNNNIPVIPGR